MPGDLRNNAWFAPKPAPDPIDDLANAIILRAVDDYIYALKTIHKHPGAKEAEHNKREIERFFASKWCKVLTDVDMVLVARKIREQIFNSKKEDAKNGDQEA